MPRTATGTFDVKLEPLSIDGAPDPIGVLKITKTFAGDLVGTSEGLMLGANTQTPGSAGYVASEHVVGELGGSRGTFILQHKGTMRGAASSLSVEVVPDSGTDELTGLAGTMTIEIVDGAHRYTFEYDL